MAMLQELNTRRIDEVLEEAAQRNVPATITVRLGESWANFHSRMIQISPERLLVQLPMPHENQPPHEFSPAERIGVSFKLKHHKHIFQATVAGVVQMTLDDGSTVPVLSLCLPTRMQRLQRRAYLRVDVPANRIVRASFWLGGRAAEPAGATPEQPVWSGLVTNISAGGFQLVAENGAAQTIEPGFTVGVRLSFGAARDSVYADAQFRHAEPGPGGSDLLGFQFMGLDQTPEGRQSLRVISENVGEFQRAFPMRD